MISHFFANFVSVKKRKVPKLNKFYLYSLLLFAFLLLVRVIFPSVVGSREAQQQPFVSKTEGLVAEGDTTALSATSLAPDGAALPSVAPVPPTSDSSAAAANPQVGRTPSFVPRALVGVRDYDAAFPDLQDVQIKAAMQWGVEPPYDRVEAEQRKDELVYVGTSPYHHIDEGMTHSIPYLVPRAALLLHRIGRSFMDSCYVKGLPLHKIIVSSVLRSQQDVERLSTFNVNASKQSCHRFGTTVDICYTRFRPVDATARPVRDDTLKRVLGEVLRDLRADSLCYVKHESRRQSCFHITVR